MIIHTPTPTFIRRKKMSLAVRQAVALTLVSADYDPDGPEVYLTFDRAMDVSGIVVVKFSVADAGNGYHWVGFEAPVVVSPTEVSVPLTQGSPYLESDTTVTVLSGNGIVAVDDGGTWAGVIALGVPFP